MSVVFNASADLLKRTTNIPSTGALTMACFVKLVGTNADGVIIGIDDGGSGDFYFLELETLALEISDGFGHALAMGNLTTGAWYFIASSSVGGASGIKGYIWNVDTNSAVTATTGTGGTARTLSNVVVGGDNFGDFPNCKLAGVRYWNAALTQNELEEELKQIAPVRQANLNSFFPLLDITNKLVDESGTGGALTAGAGTWENAENPPVPWRAKKRRALHQSGGAGAVTGTITVTTANATCAAAGTVGVAGTIAATLANATSAMAGTVGVAGTVASTLADASCSAAGTVGVKGTIASTLADASCSMAGSVGAVSGTITVTLANATCAAAGTVGVSGAISSTLANATCAVSGSVGVDGTITVTLADATCSASGSFGAGVTGTIAATLANATCSMAGSVGEVTGSIAVTLADAQCSARGSVGPLAVGGWAESGATFAEVDSSGTRAVLDGAATCAVLDS